MPNKSQSHALKIFISYAWENQGITRQLHKALQAAGANVFVDYTEIKGGDSLPARISKALGWCDTLTALVKRRGQLTLGGVGVDKCHRTQAPPYSLCIGYNAIAGNSAGQTLY